MTRTPKNPDFERLVRESFSKIMTVMDRTGVLG